MVRSERLRPLQWAGVVLAFVAIVFALRESFVAAPASRDAALMWRGDLLALVAGALWGLTTVVIRTTGLTKGVQRNCSSIGWRSAPLPCRSSRWRWARRGRSHSAALRGSRSYYKRLWDFASYLAWMWLLAGAPQPRLGVRVPHARIRTERCLARGGWVNPLPLRWYSHSLCSPLALCWSIRKRYATDRLQRCAIPSLPQVFDES